MEDQLYLDGTRTNERGSFAIVMSHGIDGNVADVYGEDESDAAETAQRLIKLINLGLDRQQMNTKGFNVILAALTKSKDWIPDREWTQSAAFLPRHPFDEGCKTFVDFIGFSSDRIYPFLHNILKPGLGTLMLDHAKFIFWMLQQEDPRQHQIWIEARDGIQSVMTAGMTDYSGSGGSAYEEMKAAVEFLSAVYGCEVIETEVSHDIGERAWQMVNKAQRDQMEEVTE